MSFKLVAGSYDFSSKKADYSDLKNFKDTKVIYSSLSCGELGFEDR